MSYRRRREPSRGELLDVSGIIAKAEQPTDAPSSQQESYAGWSWDENGIMDPNLQAES